VSCFLLICSKILRETIAMTFENVTRAVFGDKRAELLAKMGDFENWLGVRDDFRNWLITAA